MAEQAGPPIERARYHYLDALRGFLMLIGVFVHIGTLGDDPVFNGIIRASGLFRMEAFFAISGFLSAMLVTKYGTGRATRRRLAAVGLPLLSTLLLFQPFTLWLINRFHSRNGISFVDYWRRSLDSAVSGRLDWYLHLWFLFALLAYALVAAIAVRPLTSLAAARSYRRATCTRPRTMAAIMLFVVAATALSRFVQTEIVEPSVGSGTHVGLVRHSLDFLPFFLLGLLLFLDRERLMAFFVRPAPVLLAATGILLLASWQNWIDPLSAGLGRRLTEVMFTIPLTATIFALAARFWSLPRPAVRYLADASYTVYLLQFFWIYVFAVLLRLDPSVGTTQMLFLSLATFAASFAVHHFVVLQSPLLLRFFNGKLPPEATKRPNGSPREQPVADGSSVEQVIPARSGLA